MADEKFIIEILLEARNRASEALKSVGVDVDNLQKNLKGAEKTVDSFDRHLSQLDAHVTKARETIRSMNPTLDALDRKFKSLSATTVAVDKGLEKAARGLEKLAPALAAAEKFADSLEEKLAKLDKKLTEVGSRDVHAKVDVETEKAEANVDALTLRLLKLERDRIKVRVGIEQEILDREIAQTEAKLLAIGRDDIIQRVRIDVDEQNTALIDEKARAATKSFENDQQRRRAERRKTADNLIAEVNRELDAESDALAKISIEEETARHVSEQRDRDRASARAEERRREAANLEADLRRQLDARDKIRRQAEEDANKFDATNAGRAFSSKQRQEVQFEARGLGQLRAEMESLNIRVQQLKNQDVGIRAVLDSKEFNREYEAIRRRILELAAFKGEVHVGMDKAEFIKDFAEVEALAARLGLKKETIKVVVDFDRSRLQRASQEFEKFQKRAEKIASDFGDNFQITLRGVVNGALRLIVLFSEPLLSALTGVAGGLVAVGAAAGSAIGGLIGLASAAGAQAIPALGTLAVALSRVQAVAQTVALAYKEQQKSGQQQIGLDQARAAAADAITSAQEALVKAQRGVIDAQKELTDARREGIRTLTDLSLAEQNAVLSAQKSRLALANTIGTGSGSVIEAELQARGDTVAANRARVDNNRAQAGGIESLPAVESAKRQLEDAVAGVTAARRQLAAADRQAAAASERLIASSNAFEQAFGQLSRGEKKLYEVFHNSDNTGLLDLFQNNLESPIRKTTDIVLGGVARMAEGIRRILLDPSIGKAFTNLGKSIAGAFDNLRTIKLGPFDDLRKALIFFTNEAARNIKPLSKIFGELLSIFVSMAKAGSGPLRQALDGMARFFGDLADKAGSKSGQNFLANFFEQGLKSLAAFLRLGGAFLHLFLAIIGPGGGADEGVKGIDRLTASINRAADYIEANGKKVRKFFHDSIDVTSEVLKIFLGIGKLLVKAFDPKSVKAFSEFLTGFVLPAVYLVIKAIGFLVRIFLAVANSPAGRAIGAIALALGGLLIIVGETVGAIAGLAANLGKLGKFFSDGADGARKAVKWIRELEITTKIQTATTKAAELAQRAWNAVILAAQWAKYIAGVLAKAAAEKAAAAAAGILTGAQWLLNAAMAANPIVLAIAAIVALGVAFFIAYKKIKPFREAVDDVISFIKKHWVTIVEVMLGPLGLVIAGLRKWGPGILRVVRNVIGDVIGFFRRLPGRIGDILSDGIHNIGHVFESIGSRIVKAIVKGIKSAPKALWNALKDLLPGPLKGAIGVIGKGLDAIGLATGGRIGGNPSDGDSVHVRVKPGEVILNEDQQRSVGPSRINRALAGAPTVFASGRGYATGGGRAKANVIDTNSSYADALVDLLALTRNDTDKIADEFTQMRSRIRKTLKNLNGDADDSWGDFYKTTRRALAKINKTFTGTFRNIADAVYDSFKYISRATNDSLDSLGADPVKFSLAKPRVGNDAQQMATGGIAGFVGNAGERGRDMVHTVLGRGEAVLNWAHQRLVEPALNQVYGFGLSGMFKRVNAEHAGGGIAGGHARGGFTGPGHSGEGFTPVWNLARSKFGMTNFTGFDGHNKQTSTGNTSDHWYHRALDMSNGILTKQEDALNSFFKNKVPQVVKQLIWRDVDQFNGYPISGHQDHVHLAMKDAYAFNADRTAKILSRAMRGLSIDDLLVASDSAVAGGQTVDHVDRRRIKGRGPLAKTGNKASEAVRRAANKAIDRKANRGPSGPEVSRDHSFDLSKGRRVGATTFGGPGDPGTGSKGYRGDNLHQFPNSYAELSNPGTLDFAALGGLPYKQRLRITAPTGKSAIAIKRDVGKGGGPVGGVKRGIDLWYELAEKLGLGGVWSGVVKIAKAARGGFIGMARGGYSDEELEKKEARLRERLAREARLRGLSGRSVFHVAPTSLRKKIQSEGLIPDGPLLNKDAGHERGVYVWNDPDVAWKYRSQGPNAYADMDIWEVDARGTKFERDPWFDTNRPDRAEDFPGGLFSRKPIPAARLILNHENPWFNDEHPHPAWADSLNKAGRKVREIASRVVKDQRGSLDLGGLFRKRDENGVDAVIRKSEGSRDSSREFKNGWSGTVYHGTTEEQAANILANGFDLEHPARTARTFVSGENTRNTTFFAHTPNGANYGPKRIQARVKLKKPMVFWWDPDAPATTEYARRLGRTGAMVSDPPEAARLGWGNGDLAELAKKTGHDGAIWPRRDEMQVFDPATIKSVKEYRPNVPGDNFLSRAGRKVKDVISRVIRDQRGELDLGGFGKFTSLARFAGPALNKLFGAMVIKDAITGKFASAAEGAASFLPGVAGFYATALIQAALHNNKNLPTRGPKRAALDKRNYDEGKTAPALGGRLRHAPTPAPEPVKVPLSNWVKKELEDRKKRRLPKKLPKGYKVRVFGAGGFSDEGKEFTWGGEQANGGHYVVDKPTMFLAGEAGRELASFRPMAGGGFISPAKINVDPSAPAPVRRTTTAAPTTTTTVPTQSDSTDVADSATKTSKKAAKAVKDSFQKLYDKALDKIITVIEQAPVSDTKVLARAIRVLYKSFDKLNKKSTKALDVLSHAIDALFDDNGIIATFEAAIAARAARIDLGTQKGRVKVTGKGRNTRAELADQRFDSQERFDRRVLGDLGQKRDDLRTEDDLLRTVGKKATSGLAKAQNERRAKIDREIAKANEKRAEAKRKGDEKEVKDLDAELKQLKDDRKNGDDKYTKRFKSEIKRIGAKRADIAKSLADNADAILAQQDVVQRDALDRTTTLFDSLRSAMDRTKRILKARGKESPSTIASGFDGSIEANNEQVRQLADLAKKAGKSGNLKLAREIQDKIDELNASTEELLAAKFQAAIDAVNEDAQKKLTFNGVQQKLAQVGVTVAQAAQFATTGTGINGAQLGSTNYGALGTALVDQGNIMRQQRAGLADLLAQAQASGNNEQIEKLTAQINDLDASIVDNAKAIRDNTDASLAAAADARRTPLDQILSINSSGSALLKSMEALGINTQAEQQAILTNNAGVIGGQRNADAKSFADAVNQYLPGGANFDQAANLSGSALINYIRGVIQRAQDSGKFNKDELAAITNYGNSIIADATALNDNTKALKDLTGSLTQTFTSTAWSRFRQAVFNGNGGLMPQYANYIPSFGGGGVKRGDGLALLHDREVIFTPEQVQALGGVGGTEETHLHITSPIEKFDPVWASRQLSFARRNRG